MANTLNIRRRIRSVKNTRQITKAMELVAATKMRRAQTQAIKSRVYALLAWDMLRSLASKVDPKLHPLLRRTIPPRSVAVILMSSNRGLAGSFNSQIIAKTLSYIETLKRNLPGVLVDLIVVGKKGADAMVRAGQRVVADFEKVDVNLKVEDVLPLSSMVIKSFVEGKYDAVSIAYVDFVSTLVQKARIKQILPFSPLKEAAELAFKDDLGRVTKEEVSSEKTTGFDYLFEPQPDIVLEKLLPRLLEMQIYQAAVETNASEHSARMVAMKNASEAAGELISDLTLEYNQLRQAAITQEIAEISAGRLAVS